MKKEAIKIAEPCTVDWKKMTPAEGGRFCGDCKKVVRDLSKMTESEARSLLKRENGGNLCVRYVLDAKGRLFFGGDAPRPDPRTSTGALLPAGLLSRARRAAVAAAVVAIPFANAGCEAITEPLGITSQEQNSEDPTYPETNMGAMAYDPSYDTPDASSEDASQDGGDAGADAQSDAQPSEDAGPDADPPAEDAGVDAEPIN